MATKLYVGGLPYSTQEDALKELFAQAGSVVSAVIIMDKMSGRSKGFGFVEMANVEQAQAAIDALISAANLFRLADWNTTGIMRLNDMSLKWGGLFDIDTQWTKSKGHKSHRNGRSVDIENLQLEEIDTISQYTGKDTSFYRPTVDWIAQYIDFMENTVSGWRFVDENQQLKNVYRRTKKWPHFEWTGD